MNEMQFMAEKKFHSLQINEYFKQLIPPLASNEFKQLEENIIKDGCREPLCVWGDVIVDGHNRYEICTRLKIPFFVQKVEFNAQDEVIAWICANQLGRRNISEETRRYLIGKRYEIEKILGARNSSGKNQHSQKEVSGKIYHKPQTQIRKGLTAEKIAKEYHLAEATVRKYGNYSKSIDELAKKEPELISDVLTGKIKISQKNISKLSKQPPQVMNNVKAQINNRGRNFISYSNARRVIPTKNIKASIKDMPAYDPDAEISSLALTIPSWISSIERTLSNADFSKTSQKSMAKLKSELIELEYAFNSMILAMEESNGRL